MVNQLSRLAVLRVSTERQLANGARLAYTRMRRVNLLSGRWIVLAGALAASCIVNPQPEPPGDNNTNAGFGGSYSTNGGAATAGSGFVVAGGASATGGYAAFATGGGGSMDMNAGGATAVSPGTTPDAGTSNTDAGSDRDSGTNEGP